MTEPRPLSEVLRSQYGDPVESRRPVVVPPVPEVPSREQVRMAFIVCACCALVPVAAFVAWLVCR